MLRCESKEEDGVEWDEFSDELGDIVVVRSRFGPDEDGYWDEIRLRGDPLWMYKYTDDGKLYEKVTWIYDVRCGRVVSMEVEDLRYDGKRSIKRLFPS